MIHNVKDLRWENNIGTKTRYYLHLWGIPFL